MTRMVMCKKLGKELPGMEVAPMKGDIGERIYNEVSQEAWALWLKHSTMVINEYRLNPSEPQARETLAKQLDEFLFGDGDSAPPPDFVPEAQS